MTALALRALKGMGIDCRALYQRLSAASLDAAAAEQGLADLRERLRVVLPDIADQYSEALDPAEYRRYWERKMRGLHAFQIDCALAAIEQVGGRDLVLADIGDSSGNHALYLRALAPDKVARVISVNLDPLAIDKVKAKGGDAVLARAEELDLAGVRPDLFLSFEMVEHLTDPLRFLHKLATQGSARHLLMTVPWRRQSRFGGADLRQPLERLPERISAEALHIFEFNPADWLLLARLAGFTPVFTRLYRQYPRRHPLAITRPLWAKLDFEGFFAAFLARDLSLAQRYAAW
jgi:SAM-dependent methyltransferase